MVRKLLAEHRPGKGESPILLGGTRKIGTVPTVFRALVLLLLAAGPVWALDWLAERREQVAQMSADERDELREKYDKFEALSPDEQDQLRRLHEQLESDPQGDKLRRLLLRYHEWLKTLTPGERADLLALPQAERVARIKTLKREQEARAASLAGGPELLPRDIQALSRWIEQFGADHETELLAKVKPARRQEIKATEGAAHRRAVALVAWQHWRTGNKLPTVSAAEVERLAEQLSPAPRRALEAQSPGTERVRMIHDWVQAIARTRYANAFKSSPSVNAADLAQFMERDLSKAERDRLMALPQEEMRRELRRLYSLRKHSSEPPPTEKKAPADKPGNSAAK